MAGVISLAVEAFMPWPSIMGDVRLGYPPGPSIESCPPGMGVGMSIGGGDIMPPIIGVGEIKPVETKSKVKLYLKMSAHYWSVVCCYKPNNTRVCDEH